MTQYYFNVFFSYACIKIKLYLLTAFYSLKTEALYIKIIKTLI